MKSQLIVKSDKLPPVYSQDNNPDPLVRCKWFALGSAATWYITEYSDEAPDGYPHLARGFCFLGDPQEAEFGDISLDELQALTYLGIPRVERDRFWTPQPLSQVMAAVRAGKAP